MGPPGGSGGGPGRCAGRRPRGGSRSGCSRGPPVEHLAQLVRVDRVFQGRLASDLPRPEQTGQRLVEGLHSILSPAHLHDRFQLVHLVLPDQVADGRIGHHDFHGQGPARTIGPGQEGLAGDALQHQGQLGADLGLLVGGKDIDDSMDGGGCRTGMQGCQGEVAGLGDPQGRFHRLQVAQLANEHYVGVLAQGRPQGRREGPGIGVNLPLVDQTVPVVVQELERIFNGQDMGVAVAVDPVDHGRQGGGLSAAGSPRHQDQAPVFSAECLQYRRQIEGVEAADLVGNALERRPPGRPAG